MNTIVRLGKVSVYLGHEHQDLLIGVGNQLTTFTHDFKLKTS